MKKKIISLVTLIGLLLYFAVPRLGEVEGKGQENKQITVGVSAQSKPYNYYDETNELAGFEIDLFKAIEEELDGYEFDFEITEFASLFAGVDSGKFDLIANNIGENSERREKYLFSKNPYVVTHNVLITRPEAGENVTLEDMAGKSIGLVAGSLQAVFMEKYNEENPDLAIQLDYIDTDGANIIREVASERYDMTIYSTTYLDDVKNTFDLDLVGHTIEREDEIQPPGAYFLYQKNAESFKLRNEIDEIVTQLREDGTLAEISKKHFGQDDSQLTKSIVEKNEAINQELLIEFGEEEVITEVVAQEKKDRKENSSDGKVFAPKVILEMLPVILKKLPITILMTIVAAIIGITLGFIIAITKINEVPVLTQLFSVFVSFLRGTPQLVQLFLAFYGFPIIVQWFNQRFNWNIDVNGIPALLYVFVAFGLNEAAYNSETFRAAILSVDPKEIEAAKSIGLTNRQTMRRITLPSALIVAIPNLGNSLISLLKGTSLAFTVTVIDIMGQARILAGANLRFFEAYIAVALMYWIFCILIEQGVAYLERRLNVADRPLENEAL